MKSIEARNFEDLAGRLDGFTEKQIHQHLELYRGYVAKLNEIRVRLAGIAYADRHETANFSYGEFAELKRREPVAFNGVRLHELYFENLGRNRREAEPSKDLKRAIDAAFGSHSNWELDLAACGTTATGGWVILTFDPIDRMLRHNQVWEHSNGMMVGQVPILALDTWEHAFMIDYGTDKASYMKAFLKNVDWSAASARLSAASAHAEMTV